MKAELSAKQARFEMEAEGQRYEMNGEDAYIELPANGGRGGERQMSLQQELRGQEVGQELRGEECAKEARGKPVYRQPEVLILT